ncbi:hypothetical protein AOLI_G00030180 [Acnodon oligacanthus]
MWYNISKNSLSLFRRKCRAQAPSIVEDTSYIGREMEDGQQNMCKEERENSPCPVELLFKPRQKPDNPGHLTHSSGTPANCPSMSNLFERWARLATSLSSANRVSGLAWLGSQISSWTAVPKEEEACVAELYGAVGSETSPAA